MTFKPALLVVDMQNDFCSPGGATLVAGNGMDLVKPIKQLLSMPGFAMRVATLNEMPDNHKSMAHNHKGATPHESHVNLPNTKKGKGHETVKQKLWPKVCVAATWGAKMVEGLQESDFDFVMRKNLHADVVMSSALKDVHGNHKHELPAGAVTHHLGEELASNNITHVFCVGTAGDLCVSHTAMDAADMGFKAYVVEDVTMSFDAGEGWPAMEEELKAKGVGVVKMDGSEVEKVRALGGEGKKGQGHSATTMVFKGNFNGPVFFGYAAEQAKGLMQKVYVY